MVVQYSMNRLPPILNYHHLEFCQFWMFYRIKEAFKMAWYFDKIKKISWYLGSFLRQPGILYLVTGNPVWAQNLTIITYHWHFNISNLSRLAEKQISIYYKVLHIGLLSANHQNHCLSVLCPNFLCILFVCLICMLVTFYFLPPRVVHWSFGH